MSLPVRRPLGARRARRPARRRRADGALPRLNIWRLLGVALMLLSGAALYWLMTADDFALEPEHIALGELRYTDDGLVHSTMAPWLQGSRNVFLLRAAEMERALAGLPAVAEAEVAVVLPDRLEVALVEREPVFVWRTGGSDYLVDASGVLLREVLAGEALPADLPLVDDRRRLPEPVRPGDVMPAVDLRAVLTLGAVDPELLASSAQWLSLAVEQADGYVLSAEPAGWRAIFGHYTPTLRPPDIIERQVQCLRSLLATAEHDLDTIYLAPAEERCGTYLARNTPEPSPEDDNDHDE